MKSILSKINFIMYRLNERLWIRPLVFCVLSIGGALLAHYADQFDIPYDLPKITKNSLQSLLTIMGSSMLTVATFAVGSMVSAYASASESGTPRSFPIVISDDVSKNALSVFIGAFIYSIVALVALKNSYFGDNGIFTLFILTLFAFAGVVLTLVHWFDKIARLGRLSNIIEKIEKATNHSLQKNRKQPRLGGTAIKQSAQNGTPVSCSKVGYVQHINISLLQEYAEEHSIDIVLASLPGKFISEDKPLLFYHAVNGETDNIDHERLIIAFEIGKDRVFESDPRFGLVALSEIASRALSPAVNDPGTAISIIGTNVRLLSAWAKPHDHSQQEEETICDRVQVPELSVDDLFDDAFTGVARDGAGLIEVQIRLQKALASLGRQDNRDIRSAAIRHSQLALKRAKMTMRLAEDIGAVESLANWSSTAETYQTTSSTENSNSL